MKPSKVTDIISYAIKQKRALFLEGKPGVGKSSLVRAAADAMGLELRDVRAVMLDPVDLRGLPYVADGKAHVAIPSWLPTEGAGVLFLDEINSAPQAVQAACYQLVLDRAIGDYRLPDGWAIIAAGNGAADGAVVNRMGTALRSRFLQISVETDLDDWTAWAIPAGIRPEVVACVRFRPNLLDGFDKAARAFSCPRTLEFASEVLGAGLPADIELEAIQGCIGEGAAAELMAFVRTWRGLPNIDALILHPKDAAVPTEPSALYATAGAVAYRTTNNNVDRIMEYVNRLPVEFQVVYVRDARARDPMIMQNQAVLAWFAANHSLLS